MTKRFYHVDINEIYGQLSCAFVSLVSDTGLKQIVPMPSSRQRHAVDDNDENPSRFDVMNLNYAHN